MKKVIILAAHGFKDPNINDVYAKVLRAFEQNFPKIEIALAFTSNSVLTFLKNINPLQEYCLETLVSKYIDLNYCEIFIQPLFIYAGIEYNNLKFLKEKYHNVAIGRPLIDSVFDFYQILKIYEFDHDNRYGTTLLFVIHGNNCDDKLLLLIQEISEQSFSKFLACAIENEPSITKVIARCKDKNIVEVILCPLFVAPGRHVLNDLLGQKSTSLVSKFNNNEIKVKKVFKTLSENDSLIDILLSKMKSLIIQKK